MIKFLIEVNRTSEKVVEYLIDIGALYVDNNGIHASEQGIYPK